VKVFTAKTKELACPKCKKVTFSPRDVHLIKTIGMCRSCKIRLGK